MFFLSSLEGRKFSAGVVPLSPGVSSEDKKDHQSNQRYDDQDEKYRQSKSNPTSPAIYQERILGHCV